MIPVLWEEPSQKMDRLKGWVYVIFLFALSAVCSALPLSSNLTMTVDVPFGRSALLDFTGILRNLGTRNPGHRCEIRAIDTEPIYSLIGFVSEKKFPCSATNVSYSHYGYESPNEDSLKIRISRFTPTDLLVDTLFVIIRILDPGSDNLVLKGWPLRVNEKSRQSTPITIRSVKLSQDELPDYCHIHVVTDLRFPRFGHLVTGNQNRLTCGQFFAEDIHYELAAETFSNHDLVILRMETLNSLSESVSEHFQMAVQIEHAPENLPPKIAFTAQLLLDVQNFVIKTITRDVLLAEDHESAASLLIYHVVQAPTLSDGFLIRLDEPVFPIESFTQRDIDMMKIAFRPPTTDSQVERLVEIFLEIADPEGLVSETVALMVNIRPASYLGPLVVFNTGLILYEGESATLRSNRNLAVADEDNYGNLSLRVTGGLAHGRLIKDDSSVKQFVAADLEMGSLVYKHDGSDTTSDSLVLRMDDGQHQVVEFLLPVIILPVDDEPPGLMANTGILVHNVKEMVEITPETLRAKDLECPDEGVHFRLNQDGSVVPGWFFLRQAGQHLAETRTAKVSEWTQADINAGRLFYQHDGDPSQLSTTWYSIDFALQDTNDPPNLSPHLHPLSITFIPRDTDPPRSLLLGSTFSLHVNSSQVAIIGNGILHFIDDFTSDKDLLLIVRSHPQLGRLIWTSPSRGTDTIPDAFPQSLLTYGELAYEAPTLPFPDVNLESNPPPQHDLIVFDVSDKQGNTLPNATLEIYIEAPKGRRPRHSSGDQGKKHLLPPVAVSRVVLIKEGETASISPDYLLLSDPDTNHSAILLTVDKAPAVGKLWLNNRSLTLHDHFNATDIFFSGDRGLVYQNTHFSRSEDLLRLNITELNGATNDVIAEIHFRIVPATQSEEPKRMGLSKLGMVLSVQEDGEVELGRNTLLGSSEIGSYPPSDLVFELESFPDNGAVLLKDEETRKFTWKDVEQNLVKYQAKKKSGNGNALFDDDLLFKIISPTDHWVLHDKIIDHLEIQILITPKDVKTTVGKAFEVVESESAVLTEEHVVVPPQNHRINCSLLMPPQHGRLFDFVRNVTVNFFSNGDIIQRKIYYQQTQHLESEPRSDLVKLNCMGVYVDLPVVILAGNDEAPVITSSTVPVSVGDQVPLGFFVYITDADEPADNVTVDVVKFPQHGVIVFNATEDDPNEIQVQPAFQPVRNFSSGLLRRVFYRHFGTDLMNDDFAIRASDGVHTVEKTIHIKITGDAPLDDDSRYGLMETIQAPVELVGPEMEIQFYNATNITNMLDFPAFFQSPSTTPTATTTPSPVSRDMPNITVNERNGPLIVLPSKHLGVILNRDVIIVERTANSSQKELLFEIIEGPKYGSFINLRETDRSVHLFTESSLLATEIVYSLYPDSTQATADMFTIQAINEFGVRSRFFSGVFRWTWIAFDKEGYEANEVTGIVKVGVHRRGWLEKRDFVAIKSRDLSATVGLDYKEDFALQAEFQPGQNHTFVDIRVLNDDVVEEKEVFQLVLEEPQFANVQKPFVTTISISDRDDHSVIYIPQPLYFVEESVGIFNLTLQRGGRDIAHPLSVVCYTVDGTATGTISRLQQIFRPDFVTRLNLHSSVIHFKPNETKATCPIVIVDDPTAEEEERFYVNIRSTGAARIGVYAQTEIIIRRDPKDEPVIAFARNAYFTTIFDPSANIQVVRKGGDMSQPSEAEIATEDGKRLEMVYFGPGESHQNVTLKNLAKHKKADNDIMAIFLQNPHFAKLAETNFSLIHIKKYVNYTILSPFSGRVDANEIILLGNLEETFPKYDVPAFYGEPCVECEKDTAAISNVSEDLKPVIFRNADLSDKKAVRKIQFYPEEKKISDEDKGFKRSFTPLTETIGGSGAPSARGGVILKQTGELSKRTAPAFRNVSSVSFSKHHFEIVEPMTPRKMQWLTIPVVRTGNLSRSDIVRVITKDGSAKAGQDYEALDTVINFAPNRSQEVVQIRILFDDIREAKENFTVDLYALRRTGAIIGDGMAVVTITEQAGENVRFPGAPLVTSLEYYDEPVPGGWVAVGQPVVCITTCNPKHREYARTQPICALEEVDDKQTIYEWKVSHPLGGTLGVEPLQHIRSTAWFAALNGPVLDSIYFTNGSVIQCSVRAVTRKGHGGYDTASPLVTAVIMDTRCQSSKSPQNVVNVDPFKAEIFHIKDGLLRLSVAIPHRIGLVPLISTTPILDLHMVLPPEGTRIAEHPCSNMLTSEEIRLTTNGFLRHRPSVDSLSKHQFDPALRGNRTVEFYRNLDLQNCRWTFETTLTTSEITNVCGGKLLTDRAFPMSTRREVSMQLPLHITYAYFTNAIGQAWKHYDQSTILDIVFSYDSIMMSWSSDTSLPALTAPAHTVVETPKFPADIKILQVKLTEERSQMTVRFKTRTKFNGKFVTHAASTPQKSSVHLHSSPSTEFELKLLRTQENNPHPQQLWRFRTLRAAKINYIGMYNITLLPCEFSGNSMTVCDVRPAVSFLVDVMEQP